MIEAREAGDSEREPTSMLVEVLSESIVCRQREQKRMLVDVFE